MATDGQANAGLAFTLTVRVGTSTLVFDGSWNDYLSATLEHPIGHDGNPYVSSNFIVYSGFSSMESRQYMAASAEEAYVELKTALNTGDFEFGWATTDRTIDIFANKLQSINNGLAYPEGFLARAWDTVNNWWTADTARYQQLIKHELTHVVQGLLISPDYQLNSPDDWFTEGIADHMAGGSVHDTIVRWGQLDLWRRNHSHLVGSGNPVAIHRWSDFPPEILEPNTTDTYYPYFELAFRYLIDPAGHGKTLMDAKQIYFDIRGGTSFSDAFEMRMEMTVEYYEGHFWELMEGYLSN